MNISYQTVAPGPLLADFVESFWMLVNHSKDEQDVVVLPDGRFDIFFSYSATEPFHVTLSSLGNEPSQSSIAPGCIIFAVSFRLLAVEYLFKMSIASLVNETTYFPADFWGITVADLVDFDAFCAKISEKAIGLNSAGVDERKRTLFDLIYSSQGTLPVRQLAETVQWSSRQINRYFNHWSGISLKAYCSILRYRASFSQLKEGNLFPDQNFTDQAHFIKNVKKYSGVTPKELTQNRNDRFIQFSTLPKP